MLDQLALAANRGGVPKMASLGELLRGDLDLASLFESSVTQDARRAEEVAAARSVDPEALQAIVTLLAVPFLQACRTRWMRPADPPWTQGYCRICGAWPAFAEVRGIERSRYYRCARCGAEWYAQVLQCAYCRTADHEELVALVPEQEGASGAVDACRSCRGYLKSFTRLQGSAPSSVMLDDLASVELDLAAMGAGYERPPGAGCPPAISVHMSTGRGFLAWNA
jgi:FdhE protein